MITVLHKGDAPEILATLNELGIAHTVYDLRRGIPEVTWAAGMHLREIGRTRDLGGGAYELLTPTTTIDNALGRHVVAGDYPETVLAALPPLDRVAVHDGLAPIHEAQPDGRCTCKTGKGAEIVKAALAPVCPECRSGKHRNCDGVALDEATDEIVECTCPPAFGHAMREHPGRGR